MKALKTILLMALLLALPSIGLAQAPALGIDQQFQYGDSSYSWSDATAVNLPNQVFAHVGATELLITRPSGFSRLAIAWDGIGVTSLRMKVGDYRGRTFDATADIDTTPLVETMTITGGVAPHAFRNPDGPYKVSGTCPAGLSGTANYFVEVVDTTTITFHTTWVDAIAGSTATRVDLGVAAVGTCTIGGVTAIPAAAVTDGYASFGLMAPSQSTAGGASNWPPVVLWAPERLTILGQAAKVVQYWFLP